MAEEQTTEAFPQAKRNDGGTPCGECHIQPGETCDICGAVGSTPLPCPFCGADAVLRSGAWAGPNQPPKFGIECTGCTIQGGTFGRSDAALAEWNRRPL